jgi:hypothetical protein
MGKRVVFSNQSLELQEIAAHHTDTEAALKDYYGLTGDREFLASKFIGYSKDELLTEFGRRIDELDKMSCLNILSSLEAKFRIDYLTRCYKKGKDSLSRDFRTLYKNKSHRASLEEDILEIWKKHFPMVQSLISELIGAFKYRHWLAHGRYWQPKLGRKYDYDYIYLLAEQIDENLPLEK